MIDKDVARKINCKKTTDWKTALETNLRDGTEVSLLNFDCTADNTSHCEAAAKLYGMILRTNHASNSAHFFRD